MLTSLNTRMPTTHRDGSAIIDWDMTSDEAETYKLAILYEQLFRKYFPDTDGQAYRRNSLPRKGDPRKSYLFKNCWKMRRETRGLVKPEERQLFIEGNLFVIKHHSGHIEPNVICGDKAWLRFKVYQRLFKRKEAEICSTPTFSASMVNPKLVMEIDKTKRFLFEKCQGEPTIDKLQVFINNGFVKIWLMSGKVSPIYILLSPFVAGREDILRSCGVDPRLVASTLNDDVRGYFNQEFGHEFKISGVS